jgi:glycine cleavage system regulatory protein
MLGELPLQHFLKHRLFNLLTIEIRCCVNQMNQRNLLFGSLFLASPQTFKSTEIAKCLHDFADEDMIHLLNLG